MEYFKELQSGRNNTGKVATMQLSQLEPANDG
jgi:hypothetical protein